MRRLAVNVRGVVQGIGFRPFVYGAATQRGLAGWVRNRTDGVRIEVQGPEQSVHDFMNALNHEAPASARIEGIDTTEIPPAAETEFRILDSAAGAVVLPTLPADQATCAACLAEMKSPGDRRYRYPFTNCTQCGPRYTIIEALPYDRPRTTMRSFPFCDSCAAEYDDPSDRRFHAQPIACPVCGPAIELLTPDGEVLANAGAALDRTVEALRSGCIVALKGLGGFHLLVDATNAAAVAQLRQRKQREEKPFAVMFPTLAAARSVCMLSAAEERALASPAAPILLVRRLSTSGSAIAAAVAPRNPWLGVMLPYTPLHHLLLAALARPVVCTSGNLAEEPICIDDSEARARLGGVADQFLVHNRHIVRPLDDSVARVGPSGLQFLRRARGVAPLPLPFPAVDASCILAVGGQLKSTVALGLAGQAVVSQHLGDLLSADGALLIERCVADLVEFFSVRPGLLACDLHPDYVSTRLAERLATAWDVPLLRVQHHHAHVAACLAEHGLSGPVLGFAWDGAGLGSDGTLWGGEALVVDAAGFQRVAHLRPFSLPGGERAIRQPRRAALGVLYETFGAGIVERLNVGFRTSELRVLLGMLRQHINTPRTTSVGRLFDAVACLAGVRDQVGFEGQAAMELEFAADGVDDDGAYPLPVGSGEPAVADWEPLIRAVLEDRGNGVAAGRISARLHNALAAFAEEVAVRVALPRVVLTGGCFQNVRLTHAVRTRLIARGFEVFMPLRYPPNDGGISLGQLWVAAQTEKGVADVSRHTR